MTEEPRLLRLYELAVRIRMFEEQIARDYRDGKIPGVVHLSIGQEAVAAGVSANLTQTDVVLTTHRGHGHLLAKGAPAPQLMAEIWGRVDGLCKGKGGSQHIADDATRGYSTGIVGQGQPLAAGLAMAIRHQGKDALVVSYLGDGAVFAGGFHEGLVMSTAYSLPVLYVVENNLYSETTRTSVHLSGRSITQWVAGYDLRAAAVDGMDTEAVDAAAKELTAWVRDNSRPALLECETYRYHGHFEGDPMAYRSREEEARWQERDPVDRLRRRLDELGMDPGRLSEIDDAATTEMQAAAEFAAASPWPNAADLLEGVYA